jgi:Ran GTPase-activating protein (RanGAP) involved in mRNA processing and transport
MTPGKDMLTAVAKKLIRWKEPEEIEPSDSAEYRKGAQPLHETLSSHEAFLTGSREGRENEEEKSEHDRQREIISNLLCAVLTASMSGRLLMLNLSRRGLLWSDAEAIRQAMAKNPQLAVLKLSYNDLGDKGATIIAAGFVMHDGSKHRSLTVLDLGFNSTGDAGCSALALHAVAGNYKLSTLFLSGNQITQRGAMAIAGAILHGCSLSCLHLSANQVTTVGVQALFRAIAEREALVLQSGSGKEKRHQTMQELYLVGTNLCQEGFMILASMLLTNFSMRVLSLSSNGIDDTGMALLSQSLSRNKSVPLESIRLSFNEITCAGVESFMNAVWGSKTLKEIRFDNNRIRDRGAQLAAVVLTSIDLEVIDLSFNRITTVGIKALMKSLSENASLLNLGLSGIPMDPYACKALSYGLAYNSTLRYLHLDSSSIAYAGQRHIIAGVVSNRFASLRVLTGFAIGPIASTLGMPNAMEKWTNSQCLTFVRRMWTQWRDERGLSNKPPEVLADAARRLGPAPPTDVVRASRMALQVIGEEATESLGTEEHQKDVSETSPLVHASDTMLERSPSGTLRVPPVVIQDIKIDLEFTKSDGQKYLTNSMQQTPKVDPAQKTRNLHWLRTHFQSLHQIGQLPFNEADLWQLHQYFFSPILPDSDADDHTETIKSSQADAAKTASTVPATTVISSSPPDTTANNPPVSSDVLKCQYSSPSDSSAEKSGLGRTVSFQMLGDATAASSAFASSLSTGSVYSRRRSFLTMEDDEDDEEVTSSSDEEPAAKRARNNRPRISYYPRIRQLLEGTKQTQKEILSLLRRLKFVESIMFEGRNDVYLATEEVRETDQPTPTDVEMIILDLL